MIPDIEEDNEKEDPLAKPNIISAKVKHIDELDKAVNPTNMPSAVKFTPPPKINFLGGRRIRLGSIDQAFGAPGRCHGKGRALGF